MIIVWPLAIQGWAVTMFVSSPALPNSGTLYLLTSSQTHDFPLFKKQIFFTSSKTLRPFSFLTFLSMQFFYLRLGLDEDYLVRD